MQQLPTEYRKNGFLFRQVTRQGRIVIAEQISQITGIQVGYEVFETAFRAPVGNLPERETPPSSSRWGIDAFTACSLPEAERYFDTLVRRRERIDQAYGPSLQKRMAYLPVTGQSNENIHPQEKTA